MVFFLVLCVCVCVCMSACIFNFSVEPDFSSEDCSENKKNTPLVQIFHTNTTLVFKSALTLRGHPNKVLFLGMIVFYGNKSIVVQL